MKMDYSEQLFANFSGYRIFCGFSGGADSTAALLLARKFQRTFGYDLQVVHFNHHLREGESDAEAIKAERFALSLGLPFKCVDLHVGSSCNVENAAREARLAAWKNILPPGKNAVVLGHHADDRRENLLIRLLRGSNSWGLSSMRTVSEVDGVTFLRPLLHMTRQEIEHFLINEGVLTWAVDSSNASSLFLRNYLRNTLFPALEKNFPGSLKGMDRSLNALECDADFINSVVTAIPSEKKQSICFWQTQHDAVKIRLLRELTGKVPTYDLLTRINNELKRTTPELRKIPVTQKEFILLKNDSITFSSLSDKTPGVLLWEWRKEPVKQWMGGTFTVSCCTEAAPCPPDCAYFDGDLLPDILEIGPARPGEKMIPFGAVSEKKIKKLRTDRHIGAEKKLPVLRDAQGLVYWAVKVRNSALAAVSETSKNRVKFEYKGAE